MRGSPQRRRCRQCVFALLFLIAAPLGRAQDRAPGEPPARPTSRPAVSRAPASRPGHTPPATTAPSGPNQKVYVVASVLDGVTLRIAGADEPLILAGVLVPPGDPAARERATDFLVALLEGESIYVEELPRIGRSARRDGGAAGGISAMIRRAPDGLCANIEAVRQGFARFDDDDAAPNADEFRRAERMARQAKKGIWSDGATRSPPPDFPSPQNAHSGAPPAPENEPSAGTRKPGAKDAVYVTRTGTKYHRQSCPFCRNGATPISLAEAHERKLTPCSRCKPPG